MSIWALPVIIYSAISLRRLVMSPSLWCETVLSYRLLEVELALNGSIVPACWDAGVLHTLLMDATYVGVEVVPLPMRLG